MIPIISEENAAVALGAYMTYILIEMAMKDADAIMNFQE